MDDALAVAVSHGWPIWHSPGTGVVFPSTPRFDFTEGTLRESARIDFYRGLPADDHCNAVWGQYWDACHRYQAYVKWPRQNPSSTNSIGDAMEMATGVAYAAATNGAFLSKGVHRLEWSRPCQTEAWAALWWVLQGLGFTPRVDP